MSQAASGEQGVSPNKAPTSHDAQDARWTGFRRSTWAGVLAGPTFLLDVMARRWRAARAFLGSTAGALKLGGSVADGEARPPAGTPAADPAPSEPVGARAHVVWAPNASDELLRLAVEVGGIGIYETDFEQNRTRFSPELCATLGLPAGEEMAYAEASRVFDERDRAAVNASLDAAGNSTNEGKWSGVYR